MGALLLFGSVQLSMMLWAAWQGERLAPWQWSGFALAIAGLVYLCSPGRSAPDATGALLMCVAGVAWGVYSIRGRGVSRPVLQTAANFLRATPLALLASLLAANAARAQPAGVALALVSGVLTSGLGYVIWYRALPGLGTSQASIVQLLVPVLAALGGVLLLGEVLSLRLVLAASLILGGVALAVTASRR
jgi:drug/metabolite transporter (DMT)-like permease